LHADDGEAREVFDADEDLEKVIEGVKCAVLLVVDDWGLVTSVTLCH
jgi:hypothetical protein